MYYSRTRTDTRNHTGGVFVTETSLDRDPTPPDRDPPGQRPARTKTPLDTQTPVKI